MDRGARPRHTAGRRSHAASSSFREGSRGIKLGGPALPLDAGPRVWRSPNVTRQATRCGLLFLPVFIHRNTPQNGDLKRQQANTFLQGPTARVGPFLLGRSHDQKASTYRFGGRNFSPHFGHSTTSKSNRLTISVHSRSSFRFSDSSLPDSIWRF
jgi:hypothetical protein